MNKAEIIRQITVSLARLGMFFSQDTKEFLWSLSEAENALILKFLGYCQRFYRKGK